MYNGSYIMGPVVSKEDAAVGSAQEVEQENGFHLIESKGNTELAAYNWRLAYIQLQDIYAKEEIGSTFDV